MTLADAKAHLAIDHSDDDALLQRMIATAIGMVDGNWRHTGLCLVNQTWERALSGFPATGKIAAGLGPMSSVVSVKYDDPDGVEQTLAASAYDLDPSEFEPGVCKASGATWPRTKTGPTVVRVQFVAGFGAAAADVPSELKSAILMMVAGHYEVRKDFVVGSPVHKIPMASQHLIDNFRRALG